MQNKKRTGFISILIIILCLSVCIGATYAYFTDSVTSSNNIIKAGKLDVTMEWANGTADPKSDATEWKDASTGAIFNYQLWEPGYTEVRHIRIENVGTLAFQYKLVIVANGEVTDLADVIDVYYCDPAVQVADRTALAGQTPLGNLTAALAGMDQTANGNLLPNETLTITIALKMQENADNKYQELSIGTDFSIQLHATQYTYESDAFDNQYDCLHAETEVIAGYPATYEETGLTDGEKCTVCRKIVVQQEEIPTLYYSKGLIYTLNKDGKSYAVSNYGTCTDTDVIIPATYNGDQGNLPVTAIADNAFQYSSVESVIIPNSVMTIGTRAFSGSMYLEEVNLSNTLTAISDGMFSGCESLKEITIPDSVTTIGDGAFSSCWSLTNITIGNNVTTIGEDAFACCYDLKKVNIPDSVTTIGDGAFADCESLTDVTIGNNVTTIGASAFSYCSSLTSIEIPNSVTTIGDYAFSYCSSLTSITISDSVAAIGRSAFIDCSSLTSITVAAENTKYYSKDNCLIETESNTLILGCKNSIIPDCVTAIGDYAFYGCYGLTSIEIPNSVTTIGDDAFSHCSGLTSIEIPNSVTTIGDWAFGDCDNLVYNEYDNAYYLGNESNQKKPQNK